jgi:hypothetical protein
MPAAEMPMCARNNFPLLLATLVFLKKSATNKDNVKRIICVSPYKEI